MILKRLNLFAHGPLISYADQKMVFVNNQIVYKGINPQKIDGYRSLAVFAFDERVRADSLVKTEIGRGAAFKDWRKPFKGRIPPPLKSYQQRHAPPSLVDNAINKYGVKISRGQVVFHGGDLRTGKLIRPLSTSLNPAVAINEDLRMYRAQKRGVLNLYMIRAMSSKRDVYVYKPNGTKLGHEMEVLFASGGKLQIGRTIKKKVINGLLYKVISARIW